MKFNLTLTLCIGLTLSSSLFANEVSWSERFRPWLESLIGKETTEKFLPSKSVQESKWVMPKLPEFSKKATDVSVYQNNNSELKLQGQKYLILSVEKRRPFEVAFVREMFQASKRKPIPETELSHWLNVLEGGGSREGVYRGMVLGDDYAQLEAVGETLSDKSIEWIISYSKDFLSLGFKPEELKKLNVFSFKKYIAEKSLEMMDLLESHPDNLRTWYALFSGLAAKEKDAITGNEIRLKQDPETHFNWSRQVPLQHIKSEFLIKFHSIVNYKQKI